MFTDVCACLNNDKHVIRLNPEHLVNGHLTNGHLARRHLPNGHLASICRGGGGNLANFSRKLYYNYIFTMSNIDIYFILSSLQKCFK